MGLGSKSPHWRIASKPAICRDVFFAFDSSFRSPREQKTEKNVAVRHVGPKGKN